MPVPPEISTIKLILLILSMEFSYSKFLRLALRSRWKKLLMDIKKMNGKIYCIGCDKYRKSLIPEISYIFHKKLFFLLFAVNAMIKKIYDDNNNDK